MVAPGFAPKMRTVTSRTSRPGVKYAAVTCRARLISGSTGWCASRVTRMLLQSVIGRTRRRCVCSTGARRRSRSAILKEFVLWRPYIRHTTCCRFAPLPNGGKLPQVAKKFGEDVTDDICNFLLTFVGCASPAKINASFSGAEVGCQGEVGSASLMSATGLCDVSGRDRRPGAQRRSDGT